MQPSLRRRCSPRAGGGSWGKRLAFARAPWARARCVTPRCCTRRGTDAVAAFVVGEVFPRPDAECSWDWTSMQCEPCGQCRRAGIAELLSPDRRVRWAAPRCTRARVERTPALTVYCRLRSRAQPRAQPRARSPKLGRLAQTKLVCGGRRSALQMRAIGVWCVPWTTGPGGAAAPSRSVLRVRA